MLLNSLSLPWCGTFTLVVLLTEFLYIQFELPDGEIGCWSTDTTTESFALGYG